MRVELSRFPPSRIRSSFHCQSAGGSYPDWDPALSLVFLLSAAGWPEGQPVSLPFWGAFQVASAPVRVTQT